MEISVLGLHLLDHNEKYTLIIELNSMGASVSLEIFQQISDTGSYFKVVWATPFASPISECLHFKTQKICGLIFVQGRIQKMTIVFWSFTHCQCLAGFPIFHRYPSVSRQFRGSSN